MDRKRWLMAIGVGLLSLLAGLSAQQPPDKEKGVGGPHAKVTNPHGPIAMPCQNCHTYTSWKPIRAIPEFNHDSTDYPLRGMHQKIGCMQCHTSLIFKNVSKTCADCHADIHRRQFGASCESCHTVKGWQVSIKAIQDHQNRFPLVGAHALVECEECHKNAAAGQFKGLSTACFSCHQKDYLTPVLDHVSANLPTTCQTCHSMDSWMGASFNHLQVTGFALTGMHATLACNACHLNNAYKGTPATCYACHTTEYAAANNPSHLQLALPHDCGTCHSTTNWLNASFNHATFANYALTGMHATLTCAQCHINNNYNLTSTPCYSCHQTNWAGTNNPNHTTSGFPTDCSVCHSTAGWNPASFNHSTGAFPLTGAHLTVSCAQCHVNGNYTTVSTACYSCHQAAWATTTNPNHATAGFPTTCDTCHSTTSWAGTVFNHNNTPFPLTGAHTSVACALCHINNVYVGTPTDCYSCHSAQYTGTTNPNHISAGYPTTCASCHTTTAWTGATFSHTWFNTNHGGAGGVCATCHTNSANYAVFTCTGCHAAAATNARHSGVSGYVYNSTNCYACHSKG